jgi:hypothetical protein
MIDKDHINQLDLSIISRVISTVKNRFKYFQLHSTQLALNVKDQL